VPEGDDYMPGVRLDPGDLAELAELPQFPGGWLSRAPERLAASPAGFAGNPT